MKLTALLKRVGADYTERAADVTVTGISFDSRTTTGGDLFVAVAGSMADGHEFAVEACRKGAIAVIGERKPAEIGCVVPYFQVEDSRRALAVLAQEFYGNPSTELFVVGVTGTNGKTSTVLLVGSVLERGGYPGALLTTLEYRVGDRPVAASQTTPDPVLIARLMRDTRDGKGTAAVVEISSHALDQRRVDGIEFDAAVFTNLTQDHLDYHGSMEEYLSAKLKLFQKLDAPGAKRNEKVAVLNALDPASGQIAGSIRARKMFYGKSDDCDVRAADVVVESGRTCFTLSVRGETSRVALKLAGEHNVLNALAAACVGAHLQIPTDAIVGGLESVESVPGRFERVDCGQPFAVVVDYAHTDDGLRNLLVAARAMTSGRVIVLFGCGGDRDRGKRPKMARVAVTLGDYAIITSDNPRSEDPESIVLEVEQGVLAEGKEKGVDYEILVDRREAIDRAISVASAGDLVLLAGKGHETYQIFADRTIEFDDRVVAREILEQKGSGNKQGLMS
jgi:UDP-N-acetylmuramoyl-L-alanyl-D-glutamate--2,6-diaminopimelate ligase